MGAAAGFMAAGATVKAFGALQEVKAAKNAAEYNAKVADNNAAIVRVQAGDEARKASIIARKTMGQSIANAGASGITPSGSFLDVLSESAANAELDVQSILQSGEYKAAGFRNEARLDRYRGKSAEQAGYMNAAAELLGGAGRAAGSGAI